MGEFTLDYPTPKMDAIADRMAAFLKIRADAAGPDDRGVTIRELAQAVYAHPMTVRTILNRDCDRHGRRFRCTGLFPHRNGSATKARFYVLA